MLGRAGTLTDADTQRANVTLATGPEAQWGGESGLVGSLCQSIVRMPEPWWWFAGVELGLL